MTTKKSKLANWRRKDHEKIDENNSVDIKYKRKYITSIPCWINVSVRSSWSPIVHRPYLHRRTTPGNANKMEITNAFRKNRALMCVDSPQLLHSPQSPLPSLRIQTFLESLTFSVSKTIKFDSIWWFNCIKIRLYWVVCQDNCDFVYRTKINMLCRVINVNAFDLKLVARFGNNSQWWLLALILTCPFQRWLCSGNTKLFC